jgi:hypothetical protein
MAEHRDLGRASGESEGPRLAGVFSETGLRPQGRSTWTQQQPDDAGAP